MFKRQEGKKNIKKKLSKQYAHKNTRKEKLTDTRQSKEKQHIVESYINNKTIYFRGFLIKRQIHQSIL